jgi:hypothetical protein
MQKEKYVMKRQNHGLTLNTDSQWPIEEMEEKMAILHETNDHRAFRKPVPSIAAAKGGYASELWHHAVAEMAYALWENGGHLPNTSDTNWFKAEAALKPLSSGNLAFESGDLGTDNKGKL